MVDGPVSDLLKEKKDRLLADSKSFDRQRSVKKVIFIMSLPLSAKIIDDFYIKEILKESISVEYWNVDAILFKKEYPGVEENLQEIEYHRFRRLDAFKEAIWSVDKTETIFIPQITYDQMSFAIFRILSKENCCTFFFARGALPVNYKKKFGRNIFRHFDYKLPFKVASKISGRLKNSFLLNCKKWGLVKPHNVLFVAGKQGHRVIGVGNEIDAKVSKVVPINYFDYDIFQLKSGIEDFSLPSRYCVFLDEYFTNHPDFVALGVPLIDEKLYFENLNKYFDKIELEFNTRVIIAAHPKSEYKSNPFRERSLIKYQTSKLVANAEFVICHMSTSLSFAILNKKPLLFVSCNEIKSKLPAYHAYISFLADYLKADFQNISETDPSETKFLRGYNSQAFEEYAFNFLTNSSTRNLTTKEIFIEYLRSYKFDTHA